MTNTTKPNKVKNYNVKKELAAVDRIFRSIKNDKSLPSFVDFFMECIIKGNAEKVNLNALYPDIYIMLTTLLKEHNSKILLMRKKN